MLPCIQSTPICPCDPLLTQVEPRYREPAGSDQCLHTSIDPFKDRKCLLRPLQHSFNMGLSYNVYLNASRIYGCKNCKTHLSNHDDILSRVSTSPQVF